MRASANARVQVPSSDEAHRYVHNGIHAVGGFLEALCGFWHSTLPALVNPRASISLRALVILLSRILVVSATALFPLLVRKTLTASQPESVDTVGEGFAYIGTAIANASSLDYVLGGIALFVVVAPKLLDLFDKKKDVEAHSPFFDLTAALRKTPIQQGIQTQQTDDAIRLALSALRDEMSLLIGGVPSKRVTDVTLLEFCDPEGEQMQVRARTANHEEVKRPVDAKRFVAYYVALEGRNFVEHDFRNGKNPFPPKRVSVRGSHDIAYRSVLYIPIVCVETLPPAAGQHGAPQVVDSCVGVICVHSSKPYRFWRWGDHKKGVGGFADVAFSRSMPYIALIEQLLSRTAHNVKLEAK